MYGEGATKAGHWRDDGDGFLVPIGDDVGERAGRGAPTAMQAPIRAAANPSAHCARLLARRMFVLRRMSCAAAGEPARETTFGIALTLGLR